MASSLHKENKMPMQIEPYITFNGNCEQALEFYAQSLGGKVKFMQRSLGKILPIRTR